MLPLIRWALFLTVGVPTQVLLYVMYPLFFLYFHLKVKGKLLKGRKLDYNKDVLERKPLYSSLDWLENFPRISPQELKNNRLYAKDDDQHGALVHYGTFYYFTKQKVKVAIANLVREDGCLKRIDEGPWINAVSRDVLSAWTFSASQFGVDSETLKKVTNHFLKYCFGFYDKGLVSTRNSCSGINFCEDGALGLGQPQFGPAFYASSSLLSLASKQLGGIYTLIYALHWLIMGGWLWPIAPVLYTKDNCLYYDQQVTALALNSLKGRAFTKFAGRQLLKVAPFGNIDAFVQALLADLGSLNDREIDRAEQVLLRIGKFWPQSAPLDEKYFDNEPLSDVRYSMMGFHAALLLRSKNK